jgi:hypothetical protein
MCWREEIKKYDRDIEARMAIIQGHELTGYDFDILLGVMLQRYLGFIDRAHFPYWRNSDAEWVIRNRERKACRDAEWAIRNRERKTEGWYRRRKGSYRLQVNAQARRRYRERSEASMR